MKSFEFFAIAIDTKGNWKALLFVVKINKALNIPPEPLGLPYNFSVLVVCKFLGKILQTDFVIIFIHRILFTILEHFSGQFIVYSIMCKLRDWLRSFVPDKRCTPLIVFTFIINTNYSICHY